MALDHNSVPKDLTPTSIGVGVGMAPPPAGPPPCTTSARVSDGFYSNPMLLHYPDPGSALGFLNPHLTRPPHPAMVGPSGFGHSPSFGSQHSGNGVNAAASDQASEDGGGDSVSGKKVKFLCSFGGKILPRPSDGMLRYVGGHTRIISVRRDVSFPDLVQKMTDTYGQSVYIKYQLPDEDLDALVSVSCPDDLDNMMEEYDKLLEQSGDGSAKLRVFLFTASELDSSGLVHMGDFRDTGHKYVDAVNGIFEGIGGGITRKESIASAASTQNSDMSAPDNIDALVTQDVTGPTSTTLLSPKCDSATSNDNVPQSESSAPPLTLPAPPPPVATFSQPEIELGRTIPFQAPLQQQPPRYNFQQTVLKFPPPPSPYLGGFVDPHHDLSGRTDFQKLPPPMVYANPQMMGAPRPILIQPQYRDNSPTLMAQQFVPSVHMTMAPASSHLSVNPNIVQPLAHKVVAVPADQSYNQAYPPHATSGFAWNQATPQDHGAFLEGWMAQQQGFPRTADCYMCQKALPHAHSDTVVQDQKDGPSPSAATDANPLYHSLQVDDISRLSVMSPHNQGVTGLVGDVQMPHSVPRGNLPATLPEDSTQQQHLVSPSQMKQEVLVSKPVSGENTCVSAVTYQMSDQFVHNTSKEYSGPIHGVTLAEDGARPSIPNLRPVDLRKENIQINPTDLLLSHEQGRLLADQHKNNDTSEQVQAQNWGKDVGKPSESLPCSMVEAPYKYNIQAVESVEVVQPQAADYIGSGLCANVGIPYVDDKSSFPAGDSAYISDRISPGNDIRDDTARFRAIPSSGPEASPPNCGGIMNDSPCSLFSNQDPWDMRRDAPFPPPKPSKIATKREAFVMRDVQGHGEYMDAHLMDGVLETPEQFQTSEGLPEEQIKHQLQATAEEVAASVVDSSLSPNLEFSSPDIDVSVSVASHEMGGQTTSDVVIQNKMEAMDLKPEKTNFGFPLSDGIGRLQIIKNSDLEELRELGSGAFGTVYHGKWRGTDVAIKRINDRCFAGKPSEQERMRDDFWNEAIKLADLHHPNVVAFYGIVLDGPGGSVATVTEYMVNGSLRTALQKNERNLDKRKRLLILMDVAFGMEYLHSKNIVHFDLKSDNLLVNLRDPHRPICKVGDLGLSKVKCQTLISGGVRGTLPWMAPELLNGSSSLVSDKVDVFSFGIVMWELLTGEEPYADLHYGAIIGGIVSNTLRPQVPENCDPEWRSLMERCWSAEPSERPKFTEIANELRSMAAKVPLKGQGQTPTNIKTT